MTLGFGPEEQEALEASVFGLLGRHSSTEAVRDSAGTGVFDRGLWGEMADHGWLALMVPEQLGGLGANLEASIVVQRGLGWHVTPSPYLSSAILGPATLLAGNSESARGRWLPSLASGTAIAATALSGSSGRAGIGSETAKLSEGVLTGTASLVMHGADADAVVVSARSDRGEAAVVIVEQTDDIVAIPRASIDRSQSLSDLQFNSVDVESQNILAAGDAAERLIDEIIDIGMVAIAADALGAARRALDMSVQYAKDRHQFGRPIGSFQAIKHKLANMYVGITAAEIAVASAARSIAACSPLGRRRAATAGTYCRMVAAQVAGDAVQTHGGIGFTWEHDCHLLMKRAKFDLLLLSDVWAQRERLMGAIAADC